MDKQFYRIIYHGIGNYLRTNNVRFKKYCIVINRPGDMRFSGKVYDNIRFRNQFVDNVRVCDVTVKKIKMAVGF